MNLDNVEDAYPLTPAQLGMLYHTLSSPDSDVYMAYVVMTLRGDLDVALLQQSWDATYQRHEALRAGFLWEGLEEPLQVIYRDCGLSWQADSLSSDSASVARDSIAMAIGQERLKGFDVSKAPLSRLRLIQTHQNEWVLIWVIHHLLVDGWCTPIILSDVLQHYSDRTSDTFSSAEPARPFSEHVHWLARQDKAVAEEYWRDYLRGFTPTPVKLEMPAGARELAEPRRDRPERELTLSAETSSLLADFCRANAVTLSTVVHCAWAMVIAQYSGTHKPLFGSTTSGRQSGLAGLESAVGLYLNTLPVYLEISDQPMQQALQEFQRRMYLSNQYEYLSLADIQKLVPGRDGQALFDSIVVLESHSGDDQFRARGTNLLISEISYTTHSNYPLALLVIPGEKLQFRLVYDSTVLHSSHVDDMLHQVKSLVHAIQGASAERTVRELLKETETQRQLPRCIGNSRVAMQHASLHAWFEKTCDTSPDSVAMISAGQSWTYAELDQRANQIARCIRNSVPVDEQLIGLVFQRGFEQVASVLGVLKAGFGYVPMNPEHPEAVLNRIISQAGLSLLICSDKSRDALEALDVQVMSLEETTGWNDRRVEADTTTLDSLAYVMFTSGSTGTPKGVMVTHGNVMYSTQARIDYYQNTSPRYLSLSSVTFDSSVAGLYWTLCGGGTLILPAPDEEKDLHRIGQIIQSCQVTHTLCLPSIYRLILDHVEADDRRSLLTVIVAGEQCTSDLVAQHFDNTKGCRLYNEYGPTEATVWSTVCELRDADAYGVSIGRPIGSTLIMIMTASGTLCPTGVEGELVIGGEGVSKGYYRDAVLTAERFVDNPVNPDDCPTVFRTGDLGFWDHQGNIVFTGRADRQLKIRGNRIEPAEIESTLAAFPEIDEVAVIGVPVPRSNLSNQSEAPTCDKLVQVLEGMNPEQAEALLLRVERSMDDAREGRNKSRISVGSEGQPDHSTDL